jgi:cold shock protein
MLSSPSTDFDAQARILPLTLGQRRQDMRSGGFLLLSKDISMPVGTVKFFNTEKGFGFIAPDEGGQDSFVHISAVEQAGMTTLNKDQRLSYEIQNDQRGRQSATKLEAL